MRVIVQGRLKQRSYETKEGEKRTVYEIEVDEVGPSLRSATAKVAKTQRGGARRLRWRRRRRRGRQRPVGLGRSGGLARRRQLAVAVGAGTLPVPPTSRRSDPPLIHPRGLPAARPTHPLTIPATTPGIQ